MFLKRLFYATGSIMLLAVTYSQVVTSAQSAARTALPTDVAVLTGVVNDGETVPLPSYSDGTVAQETECRLIVSPNAVYYGINSYLVCYADGRVVHVGGGYGNTPVRANYMIIAVRGASIPTAAGQATLGQIKERYR